MAISKGERISDPVSAREEARRLRDAVQELGIAELDVWVMGATELEETQHEIGGRAYPAHKYGLLLYEDA